MNRPVIVRNNLWDWQSLDPSSDGGIFFDFCDALEVKDGVSAGEEGWGADHAIQAWSSFWTTEYYSYRKSSSSKPCCSAAEKVPIVCDEEDVVYAAADVPLS